MEKNVKYLSIVPLFGSVILLFYLFIKSFKGEIDKKRFFIFFYSSGFVGFCSILVVIMSLNLVNYLFDIQEFILNFGLSTAFVFGGYLLNLFTFTIAIKKWGKFQK